MTARAALAGCAVAGKRARRRHLRVVDRTIAHYRAVARVYDEALRDVGLITHEASPLEYWNADRLRGDACTHSYVCVRVTVHFGLSRDVVMHALRTVHIYAKRYFFPGVHAHAPYERDHSGSLPATDALNGEILVLPTGTTVSPADVARVANALRTIYDTRDSSKNDLHKVDLSPLNFDKSGFETALRNINAERDALRAKIDELDKAETRATRGCFTVTSTRIMSQETHSSYETLKRDDHPSQDMSSETEWQLDSRYGGFKVETFAPLCCPGGSQRPELPLRGRMRHLECLRRRASGIRGPRALRLSSTAVRRASRVDLSRGVETSAARGSPGDLPGG